MVAEFVGMCMAFSLAAWARFRFSSLWARSAFFFAAAIAGFCVAFVVGLAVVVMTSGTDSDAAREAGRAPGGKFPEILGAVVVASIVGLVAPLGRQIGGLFKPK